MWKLKGCSRCGGDIFIGRDEYGWYSQCLQCGSRGELKQIDDVKKQQGVRLIHHKGGTNA